MERVVEQGQRSGGVRMEVWWMVAFGPSSQSGVGGLQLLFSLLQALALLCFVAQEPSADLRPAGGDGSGCPPVLLPWDGRCSAHVSPQVGSSPARLHPSYTRLQVLVQS